LILAIKKIHDTVNFLKTIFKSAVLISKLKYQH